MAAQPRLLRGDSGLRRGPHLILIGLLVIGPARASLQARIGNVRGPHRRAPAPEPDGLTDRDLRRDLNAAENAELARLYDDGTISQATRQQLQHSLDLEATRLSEQR